ncbi:MAG TPA: PilN domain-containing protein [Kofleriaceae bacterium]|nr:PilN domain-containing protein [Kofleriaceae bacterium]
MIRINLLPHKRPKLAAGLRVGSDPSARPILYGVIALVAAGLAVVFLVDRPLRQDLERYRSEEKTLREDLRRKGVQLVGYAEMQKAQVDAEARKKSIERLMRAKVVPAHVLHELGEILTAGHAPTMTSDMIKKTSSQKTGDPNKRFQQDWDPMHVWLSGYSDNNGVFKLEGGAQSESDVAQLSKRLAASVYFMDVTPSGGERVTDQASGVNYVKFTITGRVAY